MAKFNLAEVFQPKIVEKAKKNKQIATKIAPTSAPKTEPKAV